MRRSTEARSVTLLGLDEDVMGRAPDQVMKDWPCDYGTRWTCCCPFPLI